MFGQLTERLRRVFADLRTKRMSEDNIKDAVREVRVALLEADVNFGVTKVLVDRIREKALGQEVLKDVGAGEHFIKLVHEELIAIMGGKEAEFQLEGKPCVILMCGLQGSGKTTSAAKLALYIQKKFKHKKVLLAACDLARPAAIEQLQTLGKQIGVGVVVGEKSPLSVAKMALEKAKAEGFEVLIVDTAGRLQIDELLMKELADIKALVNPQHVFLVVNAASGQDAVAVAKTFDEKVGVTGSILTMLDGNARAGAALSLVETTKKPILFEGTGEKVDDFVAFHPQSMADRVLGMGDIINLVKRAKEHVSQEETKELEEKLRRAEFSFDDYLKQMQAIKKMGPLKGLLKMLPMADKLPDLDLAESHFKKTEAMILSMTPKERKGLDELDISRRRRVAKGSGCQMDDVNKLYKSFKQAKQMFKNMPNEKQIEKMMKEKRGTGAWR